MAKQNTQLDLPKISQFFKTEELVTPVYKPDQQINKELVLLSIEYKEGEFGMYVELHCANPSTQQELTIQAYQESIVKPLVVHRESLTFPLLFTIKAYGKSFQLA